MHIIVMGADGQTRRISFSGSMMRILAVFLILSLGALAVAVHLWVGAYLENKRVNEDLEFFLKIGRMREYAKTVDMAPEEARRIIELLDLAIMMADNSEVDGSLVGVPDDTPDPAAADPAPDPDPAAAEQPPVPAATPLDAAWAQFHARLNLPTGPAVLETEEFKLGLDGSMSFVLKQNAEPGQRVRGRTVIVAAVADRDGNVTLMSTPPIDLEKPEQGWELGSKYSIVASKVVRGKIDIPEGGQVLSAEVLAWDEDTRELIFRKKIKIEGR
jgi:hypothetical protein